MPGFKVNGKGGGIAGPSAAPSGDPLRDHRFRLTTFMGMDATQEPFHFVKDVDLPEKVIEVLEIKCPGTTYKFAKSASFTDLKIIFYGTQSLATEIKSLEEGVHNTEDGIGDFDEYLKEIQLQMYDGNEADMVVFKFKGCWLSNTQWGSLSYGSSELKLITVVVKCNFFEVSTEGSNG